MPATAKKKESDSIVDKSNEELRESKKRIPVNKDKVKTYRLMSGFHYGPDENGISREYNAKDEKNNIIKTDQNLLKFNSPGSIKFMILDDYKARQVSDGLDTFSSEELLELATDHGLDVTGKESKKELLELIRGG